MIEAARALLLPACLARLTGCVAPYKPDLSDTAGKVRLKMSGGARVVGDPCPVVDGKAVSFETMSSSAMVIAASSKAAASDATGNAPGATTASA